MILHLIRYDFKFSQSVRLHFESVDPGNHVYVAVKLTEHQENTLGEGFLYVSSEDELQEIVQERTDWEAVIVNGLLAELWPYRNVIPAGLPKAYYLWGVEAYNAVISSPCELFEPATARHALTVRKRLRSVLYRLSGRLGRLRRRTKEVGQIFDFGIFPIKEEVDFFIGQEVLSEEIEYVFGSAGGGIDFSDAAFSSRSMGSGVLVGNSGDPNSNHFDAFLWLSEQEVVNDCKIIVPLSYGGTESYRQKVIEYGRQLFGDRFTPLLEFIPYDSYLELMASCGCVVMNHKRQQGAGNILRAAAMGATVCLQSSTTVAKGLLRMGVEIRSVGSGSNTLKLLSQDARRENMKLCREIFSRERGMDQLRLLLDKMR
ncbi:MAG: TDP-N-acetylfucosamine:lipid II N-acetylfucosaminyltransferase [Lentimonas sp.]